VPELSKYIVPIIPDEARTFGMESMFRERGIYAPSGQLYKPVDSDVLMYYKEAQNGQILEEGITEAGAMASFTAAGTAYANLGIPTIPFFIYYSMFGFQRVGDLIWAFADSRGKGFLVGGTAGRTTLLGEGLQHEDGHSHVLSSVVPTCMSYDPAFAYEIAVIIQDGIRRMYENNEDHFYYLTVGNENYVQPPMPEGPWYSRRNSARPLSIQVFGSRTGPGHPVWKRIHPQRSPEGTNDSGREIRSGRRCLERHQLYRTSPGCAHNRSLESAPPCRTAAQTVSSAGTRRTSTCRSLPQATI
jgi:hypothetical protein